MGLKGYKRPILMDVDGVLANFTQKFTRLCNSIDPTCQITDSPYETLHWNFKEIPETIQSQAWEMIRQSPYWWIQMAPMLSPREFLKLDQVSTILYVSSREGFEVCWQTNTWLRNHGIAVPNVLIVPNGDAKVSLVNTLNARIIVDDRPQTLRDLVENYDYGDDYKIIAPQYPYNAGIEYVDYYTNPSAMLDMLEGL